ncbi:MAG: hypothetical protein IJZ44_09950 [Lachnospiraceae bacterium]|nr:hypothetical protein [Lachnospiraceae bacterium]MBQ8230445.1 hypothetical protein [Lachnospiraceae bacterium]
MESITKKLKQYILCGSKENVIYDRQEIKQIIEESGMKFGTDYKESHFAGTLSALVKKGDLKSVERGKYMLAVGENRKKNLEEIVNEDLKIAESIHSCMEGKDIGLIKKLVEESVQKECNYLKEVMSEMQLSFNKMEKRDFGNMIQIKELIEYLEDFRLS